MLNPRLFGLSPAYPPSVGAQRTLTLIAKTLQGLANLSIFGDKEPWMSAMNPFFSSHKSAFEDYISFLCSPPTSSTEELTSVDHDAYRNPSHIRSKLEPQILREGVPSLPFLIDLPREYALLASYLSGVQAHAFDTQGKGHVDAEVVQSLIRSSMLVHDTTRSKARALERIGEMNLGSVFKGSRSLVARNEQELRRGSTRARGMTVLPSTKSLSQSASIAMSPPRMLSTIAASSPSSLSGDDYENGSTDSHLGHGIQGTSPGKDRRSAKRRSHTVSAMQSSLASPPIATISASSPPSMLHALSEHPGAMSSELYGQNLAYRPQLKGMLSEPAHIQTRTGLEQSRHYRVSSDVSI